MAAKRTYQEALRLFNQKAALVQQRSFIQRILKGGTGYSMKFQGNTVEVERDYPE